MHLVYLLIRDWINYIASFFQKAEINTTSCVSNIRFSSFKVYF